MAKVFGGFTPEQMGKIVPEMAGMQADEQQAYIMSQPGAAKRVGKMAEVAMRQLGAKAMPGMAEGGYVKGYVVGGLVNKAGSGLTGVMPELAQGDTAAFENFLGRPALPTPVQPVDPNAPPPQKLQQFDPNDPNMLIARPAVEPRTPAKSDTVKLDEEGKTEAGVNSTPDNIGGVGQK